MAASRLSNNAAERAIRPIALDSMNYCSRFRRRRTACGDHPHPLQDRQLNDVEGVLRARPDHVESSDRKGPAQNQWVGACPDRKSRATFSGHALASPSRAPFENVHRSRIAAARREPHEFRSGLSGVRQAIGKSAKPARAAAGSFYLVLFAPASWEHAFCSLGCEPSQVVMDCVSDADIFLLMQEQ